ncbi:MAG: type II toxin-antitoxin system VapC family toxin [Spirochaetales bacterium]|nr:type II toxin-antitoxin system VapC family toxin [Spirochaetales bacterium]
MILIDTDICIEILRGNKSVIKQRETASEDVAISFMTVAELFYVAQKSGNLQKNKTLIDIFLLSVDVIDSDLDIAMKFGELKSNLEKGGQPVADADLLIAAIALTKCDKLITGNSKHFNRFSGLKTENWS